MKRILIAGALAMLIAGNALADKPERFKARLEGRDLTGAAVATMATGKARLEVIDNGSAIAFRVDIEDFDNLLMAHIHIFPGAGPVQIDGPAGPPLYWFNGGPPPAGTVSEMINGRMAEGYLFTTGQLTLNAAVPDVVDVETLIQAIRDGRASVIVHSSDFPAGELRGTLR